eukprot:3133890-Amphidinium_carterae.1
MQISEQPRVRFRCNNNVSGFVSSSSHVIVNVLSMLFNICLKKDMVNVNKELLHRVFSVTGGDAGIRYSSLRLSVNLQSQNSLETQ